MGCMASDSIGKIRNTTILNLLRGVALISVETIGTILEVLFSFPVIITVGDQVVLEYGISHSVRSSVANDASLDSIGRPAQSLISLGTILAPGIL